ncbi:MAG: PilW family protein [Xanthomonadales bacterium]|nr:PilW family protein [Xanthomonadales bacterium]
MELVIALALSALLVLGLVQIAAAASSSTQLQRNQAQVQENARLAVNTLSRVIHRAGFNPRPWSPQFPPLGLAETSLDNVSVAGDRLAVRDWSDLNCFDNRNPDEDASGDPLFYIRESVFDINTDKSLTHQCRYGPSLTELTTQVRRQGFINDIESFQVLYGQDSDQDGNIESWVRAGDWNDVQHILGVRISLLLSSQDAVVEPVSQSYNILDSMVSKQADGKMRRVSEFTVAIKGRTG